MGGRVDVGDNCTGSDLEVWCGGKNWTMSKAVEEEDDSPRTTHIFEIDADPVDATRDCKPLAHKYTRARNRAAVHLDS